MELDERKQKILYAIIRTYMETGEPVGSRTISTVSYTHLDVYKRQGFCTFWDYTVMQRFRDYDDPREANKRIFEFHASSNNRDGLAIRAAAASLRERPEENNCLLYTSRCV